MNEAGIAWLRFVRQYGPAAKNDSMYDETIQRSARRHRIRPLAFEHPDHIAIAECLTGSRSPTSVVLTGTAGDGKTHLCRALCEKLGVDAKEWASDAAYLKSRVIHDGEPLTLHVIRDLSAWVPQKNVTWPPDKLDLITQFSRSLFDPGERDIFLLAANDGQLLETWRRLPESPERARARSALETLLVENRRETPEVRVKCFNLSTGSSSALLDRALDAFLSHEGWNECQTGSPTDDGPFGPNCPIRRNLEVLQQPLTRRRLRELFELCDYNGLHIPIRQILLLLANALLGHPDVHDRLMDPSDVPKVIRNGTRAKASVYNNLFGGNLSETKRESNLIFEYLGRFRIGHETSNRIDNVLIFGEADENFRLYFEALIGSDPFYGADETYRVAQQRYIEAGQEDDERERSFLDQLVSQRRALFFKIPLQWEEDLHLWELTVFRYAGQYLDQVVRVLQRGGKVPGPILGRLVKGLNRIFVGMLVASERDLYLATSLSSSNAKVSRLLEERISVAPRRGEKVDIVLRDGLPVLRVSLTDETECVLALHLVRYEFLSRVGDGALPSSFSRECHEDILAFKSQLIAAAEKRRNEHDEDTFSSTLAFHLLDLDSLGNPTEETVEVVTDA